MFWTPCSTRHLRVVPVLGPVYCQSISFISTERQSKQTFSFEKFYALLKGDCQKDFRTPKNKQKVSAAPTTKVAKAVDVEVKVVSAYLGHGVFKARHGKTHCTGVKSTADKEEVSQKATAKHESFDQSFDGTLSYNLLYPENLFDFDKI